MSKMRRDKPLFKLFWEFKALRTSGRYIPVCFIKNFDRKTSVPRFFSNFHISVYNGKEFRVFKLNRFHIGNKLGSFTLTRKPFHFPLHRKKKR